MHPRKQLRERFEEHCRGSSGCLRIHAAIVKYGASNFKKEILCVVQEDQLDTMEDKLIDVYWSTNPKFGYNIKDGAVGGGFKIPEVRQKMLLDGSKWMASQKNPIVAKKKQDSLKRAKQIDPSIEKRRIANVSKALKSESTRKKLSKAQLVAQNKEQTVEKRIQTWTAKRDDLLNSLPEDERAAKALSLERGRNNQRRFKRRVKNGHVPGTIDQSKLQKSEEVNSKRKATLARKREELIMKLPPEQREKKRMQLERQRQSYAKCMAKKQRTTHE